MNKKFLIFDISSILYILIFLFYSTAPYNAKGICLNILKLTWLIAPLIILIISIFVIYKSNIVTNSNYYLIFVIAYISFLIFYRYILYTTLYYELHDLSLALYSNNIFETIFFEIFEIIALNFVYLFFIKKYTDKF